MAEKRRLDTDPDYEDYDDGHKPNEKKRQRLAEIDGQEATLKKIQQIVHQEFQIEIHAKQMEIGCIDKALHEARSTMDRLRACAIASYYSQAGVTTMSQQNFSAPSIHPISKKYLGKSLPSDVKQEIIESCTGDGQHAIVNELITTTASEEVKQKHVSETIDMDSNRAQLTGRSSWHKVKKRIVVGNVSRYIPLEKRDDNDQATHKWMVYVRGTRQHPQINDFVHKVWFFLHPSYRPNDLVEINEWPFHLTRRGWGEFPVRVQLHFKDQRNKRVDIIHHLTLDRTYTGLQTLGTETVVDVEIEKEETSNVENQSTTYQTNPSKVNNLNIPEVGTHSSAKRPGKEDVTICHTSPRKAKERKLSHSAYSKTVKDVELKIGNKETGDWEEKVKLEVKQEVSGEQSQETNCGVMSVDMTTPDRPDSVSSGFQEFSSCHSTPESVAGHRDTSTSVDSLLSTPQTTKVSVAGHRDISTSVDSLLSTPQITKVSSCNIGPWSLGGRTTSQIQDNPVDDIVSSHEPAIDVRPKKLLQCRDSKEAEVTHLKSKGSLQSEMAINSPEGAVKSPVKFIKLLDNRGRTILVPDNLLSQLQSDGQKQTNVTFNPAVSSLLKTPGFSHMQKTVISSKEYSRGGTSVSSVATKGNKKQQDKKIPLTVLSPTTIPTSPKVVFPLQQSPQLPGTSLLIPQSIKSSPSWNPAVSKPQQQEITSISRPNVQNSTGFVGTGEMQPCKYPPVNLPQLLVKTASGDIKLVNSFSSDGTVNLQSFKSSGNSDKTFNKTNCKRGKGVIVPPSSRSLLLNNSNSHLMSQSLLQSNNGTSGVMKLHGKHALTVRELLDAKNTSVAATTFKNTAAPVSLLKNVPLTANKVYLNSNNTSQQPLFVGIKPRVIQTENSISQPKIHLVTNVVQQTESKGAQQTRSKEVEGNVILNPRVAIQPTTNAKFLTNATQKVKTFSSQCPTSKLDSNKMSTLSTCKSTSLLLSNVATAVTKTQIPEVRLIAEPSLSIALGGAQNNVKSLLKSQNHQDQLVMKSERPLVHDKLNIVLPLQNTQKVTPLFQNISTKAVTKKKPVVLMKDTSKRHSTSDAQSSLQKEEVNRSEDIEQRVPKVVVGESGQLLSVKELVEKQLKSQAPKKVQLPNYRLSEFHTFEDLLRTVVRHFPLVAEKADRTVLPYCTSSVSEFLSWNIGKRRAAELCRASAVRKALTDIFVDAETCNGEKIWSKRKLILWCRRHAFTPLDKEVSCHLRREPMPLITESYSSYSDQENVLQRMWEDCKDFPERAVQNSARPNADHCIDIVNQSDETDNPHFTNLKSIDDVQSKGLKDIILPPQTEAQFINESCNQIGMALQPAVMGVEDGATVRGHLVQQVLFHSTMRLAEDILREAFDVIYTDNRLPVEITVHDVYEALNKLQGCDFLTNENLGTVMSQQPKLESFPS